MPTTTKMKLKIPASAAKLRAVFQFSEVLESGTLRLRNKRLWEVLVKLIMECRMLASTSRTRARLRNMLIRKTRIGSLDQIWRTLIAIKINLRMIFSAACFAFLMDMEERVSVSTVQRLSCRR